MTTQRIVQSHRPRLPPANDGVGDYAVHLARQLNREFGLETRFIVCDPTWEGSGEIHGFPVRRLSRHSAASLKRHLTANPALLHFVNYGYEKRGCPVWLLEGLLQWKRRAPAARLVTMFHELYAFGPLWRSSFWLSPVHRMLAARLCRLSDAGVTSMRRYADRLAGWDETKTGEIPALPVFSNIGEPAHVPPLAARRRRMVVFGGKWLRTRAYTVSLDKLKAACRMSDIQEVVDVGPELDFRLPELGVPVAALGKRETGEISQVMLNSRAGFIDYPPAYLAKSTVFASYCAHGLARCFPGRGKQRLTVFLRSSFSHCRRPGQRHVRRAISADRR